MWQYVGFEPESIDRSKAKSIFWKIERGAPSDSCCAAIIRKSHEGYFGEFRVSSKQGVFSTGVASMNVEDLLEDIFFQMIGELDSWKRNRRAA